MSAARSDREVIKINLSGVTVTYASVLPEEVIKRIAGLDKRMRDDHRGDFANEVGAIWDMCERAFAAEFDAGFEHAQETIVDWREGERGV